MHLILYDFFFFQNEWCSGYYKFYHKGLQYDVSISSQKKKKKMMCQFLTTIKNKTKQELHKKFVYYLVHVILIIFITTSICKVLYSNF